MSLFDALVWGDTRFGAVAPPAAPGAGGGGGGGGGMLGMGGSLGESELRIITVQACVSLISSAIAALPRKIVEKGDRQRVPIEGPEWRHLLGPPNPATNAGGTFWRTVTASLLLHGNSFIWKSRDRERPAPPGGVNELWFMAPQRLRVEFSRETGKVFHDSVSRRTFTPLDVMHMQGLGTDGLRGLSPIQEAATSLGSMMLAERGVNRFLRNGMTMAGFLRTPEKMRGADGQARATELKDRFQAKVQAGVEGIGDIAVLDNGAEFEPLTVPWEQMQFLELREFQRDDLISLFRCPPHMLGIGGKDSNWGTGVEQRSIQFVTYTLIPWIRQLEEVIETELLPDDLQMRFNVTGLLRGDMRTRAEYYSKMRDMGVLSADDILEFEDLPPRPIDDDYHVKSGNTLLPVGSGRPTPVLQQNQTPRQQAPIPPPAAESVSDEIYRVLAGEMVPYVGDLIERAHCGECGKLIGRIVNADAWLWCSRCGAERQPRERARLTTTPTV